MSRIPATKLLSDEELWSTFKRAAKVIRSTPGMTLSIPEIARRSSMYDRSYGIEAMRKRLEALPAEKLHELGIGTKQEGAVPAIRPRSPALIRPLIARSVRR